MPEDLDPFLDCALSAARQAGDFIMSQLHSVGEIRMKKGVSPVSEVDLRSEALIRKVIGERFPDHQILGEEQGLDGSDEGYLWIVDPIDGTRNFIRGMPSFCVSVALTRAGEPLAGVVHDPNRSETFSATAGGGAFLNERRLRVSGVESLSDSVVASGFSRSNWNRPEIYTRIFGECLAGSQAMRRNGSSALELCYVASGRTDAFWQFGLNAWDIAAGVLLVREAGGRVTDVENQRHNLTAPTLVASNSGVHQQLMGLLQSHYEPMPT